MKIFKEIPQNQLIIRLFVVCVLLAFLFVGNIIPQNSNKNTTEPNNNSQTQNSVKDSKETETKLNEQIVDLKKQIAELTQKVGDNKQAYYDSYLNTWNLVLTGFGLIIVVLGYFGWKSISDKVTEIKTDNANAIETNKSEINTFKTELGQRVTEIKADSNTILEKSEKHIGERILTLEKRITEFKIEQKEGFARFEKESNERIDRRGSDLQNAIQKAIESSFVPQLNELSEQSAELKTDMEYIKAKIEPQKAKPKSESKEFTDEVKLIPNKGGNAFDEE